MLGSVLKKVKDFGPFIMRHPLLSVIHIVYHIYVGLGIKSDEKRIKNNRKKMHMDENMIQYHTYVLHKINFHRHFAIMILVEYR
jgi:hypothetical protein